MSRLKERTVIYNAAKQWKIRCLLSDGSVFTDRPLWTLEHLGELETHFVNAADTGERSFEDKLRDQLGHTSPATTQLAAEMLWVMMLFPSGISAQRKEELVRTIWSWSGSELPRQVHAFGVFEHGIGGAGPGYNNHRPLELAILIRFAAAVKRLDTEERGRLLNDGWAFVDWFDRLQGATSRQFRHMVLHLLFPDDFERVSSTGDKKRIDAAFAYLFDGLKLDFNDRGPAPAARDRRLRRIRSALSEEYPGLTLDFYTTPQLKAKWQTKNDGPPANAGGQKLGETTRDKYASGPRAWAIGAGEGARKLSSFLDEEVIAIEWEELGDLTRFKDSDEAAAALKQVYGKTHNPWNDALACYQFAHEMAIGDEVFVKQGRSRVLAYGKVTGKYEHDASQPDFRNRRSVDWLRQGNWTLPEAAHVPTKTLTEVTQFPAFRAFMKEHLDEGSLAVAPTPYSLDDIMNEAFLERAEIERILQSLRRRRNVILQGSPGVGKSFLARRLAYALVGARTAENVQTVQFHQSYAYEDFVQGWRPNTDGGFERRNGAFYDFCRRAQEHPLEPHVFIIDEINRGNLSKIFGELLLLVETDKRAQEFAIPLTYSESATDTFFVPANVYIIGLMNTADRSLAMVDYALRRRFAFITLSPAFDTNGFRRALAQKGIDAELIEQVITRVTDVNREIESDVKNLGAGFVIGHSYFCPTAMVEEPQAWYSAVVREEIRPLLDEYWFDSPARVATCMSILES